MAPVLEVSGLNTVFHTRRGTVRAVQDVSFSVNAGETLAIVGESGCGKSVTSFSLMGLLGANAVTTGKAKLQTGAGQFADLIRGTEAQKQALRGKAVSMIFQEPMTSLNPLQTVADQIAEAMTVHGVANKKSAMAKAVQLLKLVGISDPETRAKQYPHQLSGGMRKRVAMAASLIHRPKIFLMDEPFEGVDAVGARMMKDLLADQVRRGATIFLTSHVLEVVERLCDHIAIINQGKIVAEGSTEDLRGSGSLEEAFVRAVGVDRQQDTLEWL